MVERTKRQSSQFLIFGGLLRINRTKKKIEDKIADDCKAHHTQKRHKTYFHEQFVII